jgi:predicted DNA-binding transcriptional regulator AlpA
MKEYKFILKFSLPDNEADPEIFIEKLGEAGCDDALIGIGLSGRIALDFTRKSSSALEAVLSAIKDVKRAIPGVRLIEAAPDLVGLTDIGDILGFTRQNMRKMMLKNPDFPPPFHDGKPSIWHLAKILQWLNNKKLYIIEESLLDIAMVNMQFNIAKDMQNLEPAFQTNIQALFA